VGNLTFHTTGADLRNLFGPHGAVASAQVITERSTGRSRGFGFVEMPNDSEVEAAIAALDGSDAGGRWLTVNEARAKTEGQGRFRGGRGSSRDDYRGSARLPRAPRC